MVNSKGPGSTIEATMKLVRTLVKDERYNQIALIGRRHISLFPYVNVKSLALRDNLFFDRL